MEINNVQGVRSDINEMLVKMREVLSRSKALNSDNNLSVTAPNQFNDVFAAVKNSVSHVNQSQAEAETLKNSYITGDGNVSMSQVIVATHKSQLAFEGLISVRNKILEAYKEIMNMAV